MKLIKYKEAGHQNSQKVSDLNRQLAFAGIAVCWIFKNDSTEIIKLPSELILPLTLFVLTLALDILQYIYLTVVWTIYWRIKENKFGITMESDFKASHWWSTIAYVIFGLKIIVNVVGYTLIIRYLYCLFLID